MENLQHIIQQSIKGNVKAQRELYDAYNTKWYMLSLRYGKNKMQAEDIFQEGMIQIFNSLHQYNAEKSAFATWSSRVLINAGLRYLKKNNWMASFDDLDYTINTEDKSVPIYSKLAVQELTLLIQDLPLGYRIVFNMFVLEGYSHKEIAKELGISEGTSKSQLSKARREMRKKLESQLTTQG